MHPGRYVSFTKDGKRTALRQLYRQTFVDLFSRDQNRADAGTKRTARACFFPHTLPVLAVVTMLIRFLVSSRTAPKASFRLHS